MRAALQRKPIRASSRLPYRTAKEKMPSDNSAVPQPDAFDQKVSKRKPWRNFGAEADLLALRIEGKARQGEQTRPTGHRSRVVRPALDLVPWVSGLAVVSVSDPAKDFDALVEKPMLKERAPERVLEAVHRLLRIGNGNRWRSDVPRARRR